MDSKITRTRVIIPQRRPDQLTRPRVLKRLFDQGRHKLLIVVAPPGYGKTSLLIDFAEKAAQPVCWYAIDSLDMNPSRFFAHIVASIEHVYHRFGRESRLALQEQMANNGALVDLVPTIVNELYNCVEERFTLVLDDFHLVQENPEIQTFLNAFIQQVEDSCQIIVSSRRLIRLPDLPLMVARSLVGGISMEDLYFQTDEIQALLAQNYDKAIDEETAIELSEQTEGWITGLLLSTELTHQNPNSFSAVQRATGVDLYEYLAQQVFLRQPVEIQEFLLRTSLLDEFNETLCQQIFAPELYSEKTPWQTLFDSVVSNNLFILPIGDGEPWYRYHNLFQDFLSQRIRAKRPEEANQILSALAEYYIAEKAWEKAHRIRQQQGDTDAIIAMIEAAIPALTREWQLSLCAQWLRLLPETSVLNNPLLLAVMGYTDASDVSLRDGYRLLASATEQLATELPNRNYATALIWRASVRRMMGEFEAALCDADKSLAVLREIHPDSIIEDDGEFSRAERQDSIQFEPAVLPSDELETVWAIQADILRVKGIIYSIMGDVHQGTRYLEQAVNIFSLLSDGARGAFALADLATANMNSGRYEAARSQFHKALENTSTYSRQRPRIYIINNLGVLYHLSGNYQKAYGLLSQAVESARQDNHTYLHALSLTSQGDLLMDLMDVDHARSCYQEALDLIEESDSPYLILHIEIARAQIACMAKEWAVAFDSLDKAGRAILANHDQPEWHLYKIAMGQFYLARDKNQQAVELFLQALDGLVKGGKRIQEAQTRLFLAGAYYRLDNCERATEELQVVASIVTDLHVWQPLIVKGQLVSDMLEHIGRPDTDLGRTAATSFAADLLSRSREFAKSVGSLRIKLQEISTERDGKPSSPERSHLLSIRTLGRIEITYAGNSIQNWQGRSHISRDLFLCLVAHKNGLSKEEIGAHFWPESAPVDLKARFKNAIYRLRKVLAPDVILFDGEVYQFNHELDCYCDAQAFEEHVTEAYNASSMLHEKEAYQRAVALYNGPYLPDVDAIWAWLERERLGQMYIDGSIRLAEIHLEYGETQQALRLCQTLLAEDQCLEEAHRLVMRIHAANGNRGALIRQYELCQQNLQDEFGAPPSEQTRFLFISLTS